MSRALLGHMLAMCTPSPMATSCSGVRKAPWDGTHLPLVANIFPQQAAFHSAQGKVLTKMVWGSGGTQVEMRRRQPQCTKCRQPPRMSIFSPRTTKVLHRKICLCFKSSGFQQCVVYCR